jgi:hypothetical protein
MSGEPKILLCNLWQRTSANGNEYLSGFIGKARIIGFRGEPTADGTPTWDIYIAPGKEQTEARAAAPRRSPRPSRPRPAYEAPASGDPRPFDDELPEQLR